MSSVKTELSLDLLFKHIYAITAGTRLSLGKAHPLVSVYPATHELRATICSQRLRPYRDSFWVAVRTCLPPRCLSMPACSPVTVRKAVSGEMGFYVLPNLGPVLHVRLKRVYLWQRKSAYVSGEQSFQVTSFSLLYVSSLLLTCA